MRFHQSEISSECPRVRTPAGGTPSLANSHGMREHPREERPQVAARDHCDLHADSDMHAPAAGAQGQQLSPHTRQPRRRTEQRPPLPRTSADPSSSLQPAALQAPHPCTAQARNSARTPGDGRSLLRNTTTARATLPRPPPTLTYTRVLTHEERPPTGGARPHHVETRAPSPGARSALQVCCAVASHW